MTQIAHLVIRGARLICPVTKRDEIADVVVERGVITRVGKGAGEAARGPEDSRVVEASGKILGPGFVDAHAHFREPGFESKEDIESGLRAAARGGYVAVAAMPNTSPVNDTAAITKLMVERARSVGGPKLLPIGAITKGQKGETLAEMTLMRDAGAVGFSDDGRCVVSSGLMRRAFEYAKTIDVPLIQHAEDHSLTVGAEMHEGAIATRLGLRGWPRVAEDIIVARDLLLASYTGGTYHLAHASTHGSVALLREAKSRGLRVTAEVTPHHLLLTHEAVLSFNTLAKVNPPLREQEDVDALRAALADGTIDMIATDHAPHGAPEKSCTFTQAAFGIVGLESAFALIRRLEKEGVLTFMRIFESLSTAPSKLLGVIPPALKEGARANFALIDPARVHRIERGASKSVNTPFFGQEVEGRVEMTVADGAIVWELT